MGVGESIAVWFISTEVRMGVLELGGEVEVMILAFSLEVEMAMEDLW